MSPGFKAYIGAVTVLAVVIGAFGLAIAPLWPAIGDPIGLTFWLIIVLLGSSASVRMPGGTLVDVGIAPLVACAVLGGPTAAVVAATVGTFEVREIRGLIPWVRGGVPWYGTAYNHASLLIPSVLASLVYGSIAGHTLNPDLLSLSAVLVAGGVHYAANNALTASAVAIREQRPL